MKNFKIQTIDLQAREWFDKVNGNSYFSAIITLNFGLGGQIIKEHNYSPSEYYEEKQIGIPFEYGYGSYYEQQALHVLQTEGYIPAQGITSLSRYCIENDIVFRSSKKSNCLKSEVKNLTKYL